MSIKNFYAKFQKLKYLLGRISSIEEKINQVQKDINEIQSQREDDFQRLCMEMRTGNRALMDSIISEIKSGMWEEKNTLKDRIVSEVKSGMRADNDALKDRIVSEVKSGVQTENQSMQNILLSEIQTLKDKNKNEEPAYVPILPFWYRTWHQFLTEHQSDLIGLKEDLKKGLDADSQSFVDYFIWLYTDVISPLSEYQHIRYERNFVWHALDFALMAKIAAEEKILPKEFDGIKEIITPFHSVRDMYGLKSFDKSVLPLLDGKDVIDGGAWIGDSSISFSMSKAKKVFAFEPNPENFEHLKRVADQNGKIIPFQLGLLGHSDSIPLKVYTDLDMGAGYMGSDISDTFSWKKYREIQTNAISIDEFVPAYNAEPGLIKLDVEGKEYEVIRGAEKTIRKYRPVIICALYHNPVDFFCIKPFLESLNLGYRFAIRRLDIYMPTTDVYLLAYAE